MKMEQAARPFAPNLIMIHSAALSKGFTRYGGHGVRE